ncbi:MAG: glycosyltransferase [Methylotenera sp.]
MVVTLVCSSNSNAASKMCAMLASIGFNGFAPYVEDKGDHRFNTFVSERLSALMQTIGDNPSKCKNIYEQLQTFADAVQGFAETLDKKRVFLCHPQLHVLIPYFKHLFELRVIFVLDALLEPDSELTLAEWDSYYQQRTAFNSSLAGLIENQHFPYLLVKSTDFFQNRVGLLKRVIQFQRLKTPEAADAYHSLQREANKHAQRIAARALPLSKIAVVTAYAKEPLEILQKCIASVKKQTVPCVHILVADGFANDVIAQQSGEDLLHIALPENIGFNQCGVGIELAFAMGFEAVAILDADNWYEPDHIETSLISINDKNADVVFAKRKVVFPDGEVLSVEDPQDNTGAFADTNCMVLTNKVAALTPIWLMWPKVFGAGEDRAVSICTRMLNFNVLMNPHETVWYQTNWAHHYKLQNKKPVAPLRKPTAEFAHSFDQKKFFEASGFNLPIKQAGAESLNEETDFTKLGMVIVNPEASSLKS